MPLPGTQSDGANMHTSAGSLLLIALRPQIVAVGTDNISAPKVDGDFILTQPFVGSVRCVTSCNYPSSEKS